ncbi:hypothetical protein RA267_28025, partial [Pseudomonas syringae pv. tagetis]|uniref:hypothetical protein n=1 Tax=Pseudomonas syringae group genomosp. 7 TaxID=251699 RepID=UPI0037703788
MQYLMAFEAFNEHLPTVYGHGLREWFAQLPSNARVAEVLDSLYTQFSLESDYYRPRRELHAL